MQRSTWGAAPSEKQKIDYVPSTKANAGASDAEKESVRVWNLMQKTLMDNGLMKEKGER